MRRTSYDRMSAHDAGYLSRETARQPLHHVTQFDIDERLSFDDVKGDLARRLDGLPLAHRRTRYPLLVGRPVWVDDAEFDAARQITAWPHELHDSADADAVFVEITARRLPRDRPLWNLTVASGPGDRTTLWLSVHHAMMDGVLLTSMLRALFTDEAPAPTRAWRPQPAPSRPWLLALVFLRRLQRVFERTAKRPPTSRPPEEPHPTTMTGQVSAARAIADTTVSLAAIKGVRSRTGATINDLFLAAVTEALRGYLQPPPEVVLALVPRNVRTESESGAIGNRAWSMLVPLPTGDGDPDGRLARIRASTQAGKATDSTSGTQGWRFDIALTNVPLGGPFAVLGHPVIHMRSAVPLQGQNRLVGVLITYGDALTVSYTADASAYPDVTRLAELTQQAWQRMFIASNV